MSTIQLNGIIRGQTIELDTPSRLPDGQHVIVQLEPTETKLSPGEGLRRAFGAWNDDAEGLEEFLRSNRVNRKNSKGEIGA